MRCPLCRDHHSCPGLCISAKKLVFAFNIALRTYISIPGEGKKIERSRSSSRAGSCVQEFFSPGAYLSRRTSGVLLSVQPARKREILGVHPGVFFVFRFYPKMNDIVWGNKNFVLSIYEDGGGEGSVI